MNQNYTGSFPFKNFSLYTGLRHAVPLTKRGKSRPARRLGIIGTYAIVNPRTGQVYVGSSADVFERWASHFSKLKTRVHPNDQLQDAYDEDGDILQFVILEHTHSTDNLLDLEWKAARQYDLTNLYNYKVGNDWINGWSTMNSQGNKSGGYVPKSRRAPNSIGRWFDHTGTRRYGVAHA